MKSISGEEAKKDLLFTMGRQNKRSRDREEENAEMENEEDD